GQMPQIRGQWDQISTQVVEGFWPRIQETAQEFMGWLGQNKEQIIEVMTNATEVAIKLFQWVTMGVDYLIRGVQTFGAFLGGWWATISANFTVEKFVGWITEMGKAGLLAAKGLVLQLVEMVLGV